MSQNQNPQVIVVTGASSGFGAMSVRALAQAGHTAYTGIRATIGRNAQAVADAQAFANTYSADLRPLELDVSDQASVDAAIAAIIEQTGRLEVVVHNVGHMTLGPTEAFFPEEVAAIYDTNVVSTQRVNRAALPHLRRTSLLAPYFAAKAAEDALAVSYAAELVRFGIETTIIVPGSYTTGTSHFAHANYAADTATAEAYEQHYGGLMDQVPQREGCHVHVDAPLATSGR